MADRYGTISLCVMLAFLVCVLGREDLALQCNSGLTLHNVKNPDKLFLSERGKPNVVPDENDDGMEYLDQNVSNVTN